MSPVAPGLYPPLAFLMLLAAGQECRTAPSPTSSAKLTASRIGPTCCRWPPSTSVARSAAPRAVPTRAGISWSSSPSSRRPARLSCTSALGVLLGAQPHSRQYVLPAAVLAERQQCEAHHPGPPARAALLSQGGDGGYGHGCAACAG